MKILIISQVFWPDTVATGQVLWDLAESLQQKGHSVKVICSQYPYEIKKHKYAKSEIKNGVIIERINHTGFGKSSTFGRLLDFATFNIFIFFKLLLIPHDSCDGIIGTSAPPLLCSFGTFVAKLKRIPFCYWALDIQPELAIASNMIGPNSITAKVLTRIGHYTIKNANLIIALDKYMKEYLVQEGASKENVSIFPIWPVMDRVYNSERMQNPFRTQNDFGNKIVVMYSGNHAYVHPLDTLLDVAYELRNDNRFLFVFVGGGVRKKDVSNFKTQYKLENIQLLDFQPRENIHISLSSADLQVVIMGESQVGFTHPNKIYGALFLGKPILYIGPKCSHITDILDDLQGNISVLHKETYKLKNELLEFILKTESDKDCIRKANMLYAKDKFQPQVIRHNMVEVIEKAFEQSFTNS